MYNKRELLFFLIAVIGLVLMPSIAFGATSVGDAVSVGSTLAVTGATTLNGAVTLGDATNDDITVSGRLLGNINISDGSTATTTMTYNTIKSGVLTGTYNVGKFFVNTDGSVSTSGTLHAVGATTLDGAVTLGDAVSDSITVTGRVASDVAPSTNNTRALGAFSNAWSNIYASSTAFLSSVTTTQITPWANNTSDLGGYTRAWKDIFVSGTIYAGSLSLLGSEQLTTTNVSSTNMTAGGYLTVTGNTTIGDTADDTIALNGRISSGVWASSTLYVGSAAGGEDLVVTNNAVTIGTGVNSSTLDVFGNTTITGNLRPQASHNNLYNLGGWGRAWSNIFSSSTIYGKHANFTGDVTIGDDTSDSVIINGRISTFLLPNAHNLGDIGSYTSAWKDIYSSSTIYGAAANFTGSVTLGNGAPGTVITINGQVAPLGNQLVPNIPNIVSLGSFANSWSSVFASNTIYAKDAVFSNTVGTSSLYLKSFGDNTGSEVILEDVDGNGCASIMVKDGLLAVSAVTCPAL